MGGYDKSAPKYRYQGDLQQLNAAITRLVPMLETLRPISLHDDVLICQWLFPEESLRKPLDQVQNELAFALQKVLLMATRIAGATLPAADLATATASEHHIDYRRNALTLLIEGHASPEQRAALARESPSMWYDVAATAALVNGQPREEALLQAEFKTLGDEGREHLLEGATTHHPGAGVVSKVSSHELLKQWITCLREMRGQEVAVPHLIACYYEGLLPAGLIIENLRCVADVRLSGFLVDLILHGSDADRQFALAELNALDWESWREDFQTYAPNLSDEVKRYVIRTFQESDQVDQRALTRDFGPPAHLELAEAFGETRHFKRLLQQLWEQDDRACIPHLIACYHLPYLRDSILAFISRQDDERVLGFLHQVLREGSSSEVKSVVQVLSRYGDRISVRHLKAVYAHQGRANRNLIDATLSAITARDPSLADAGSLSVARDTTAGALSLSGQGAGTGEVSRVNSEVGDS